MIRSSVKNSKTDEELTADFKLTGDRLCVEILFNRYCHLVFAVALKYLNDKEESKDVVLEIFEKIPAHILRYEIKNFSHWLYRVTKNHCYQILKKKKNHLSEEAIEYHALDLSNEADEKEDLENYFMDHLEESLESLNQEQKKCITLFYLDEKSYEEIEIETGFSYNQVKSHIQNGKRNLKIYLSGLTK